MAGFLDSIWDVGKGLVGGVGDVLGFDKGGFGWDGGANAGLAAQSFGNFGDTLGRGVSNTGDFLGFDGSFGYDGDGADGTDNGVLNSYQSASERNNGTAYSGASTSKINPAANDLVTRQVNNSSYLNPGTMGGGSTNKGNYFTNTMDWLDKYSKPIGTVGGLAKTYLGYQANKDAQKTLEGQLNYNRNRDKQGDRKRSLAQSYFTGGFN